MKFVDVTLENVELAISVQNDIFPFENAREEIECSVYENKKMNRMCNLKYWLLYDGDVPVGICGIDEYDDYPEDAFMGWFGVLKQHRRKGYGTAMYNFVKQHAVDAGYKAFRLYTDEKDNDIAVKFYHKMGMTPEVYTNVGDKTIFFGRTIVFSIALDGKPLVPWNNRMLYLEEEFEAEQLYATGINPLNENYRK